MRIYTRARARIYIHTNRQDMNRDSYSQKKSKNAQSQKKAIDILINRTILHLSTATNTAAGTYSTTATRKGNIAMSNKVKSQLRVYANAAVEAFKAEETITRNATLHTIATCVNLLTYIYVSNGYESKDSIIKSNSQELNENRARKALAESIFGKEKSQLQNSAGRVIYNKLKAAIIVFNENRSKLINGLTSVNINSTNPAELLTKAESIVNSYESLAKILAKAKGAKAASISSVKVTTDSDSDSDSNPESNKTEYERIQTAFTQILNRLGKVQKSDITPDFIKMIESNIGNLDKALDRINTLKKFSYKTAA